MEDEYLYPDEDEAFEQALLSLSDPEPAFSSSSNIPSSSTSTTPRTRPISPSKPHSTYTERDTSNTSPVKTSFTLREGDVKLDGSARNGEVLQWKRMERDQQRETSVLGQKRPAPKDDTYNPVGFGEFGRYMRNKRAKLQLQNKALIEEDSKEVAQVFKGLAIYINGHTTDAISLPELQHLLILHGGIYVPYLDKKALVTHIIATNLTPSKRKEFAAYKVATPAWLIDSAKEGRLLDWKQYALLAAEAGGVTGRGIGAGEGEQDPTGTQNVQRSLLGMFAGGGKKPAPSAGGTSANVETIETLSARGQRLAREAMASSSTSSTASAAVGRSAFFQPRSAPPSRPPTPSKPKPVPSPALPADVYVAPHPYLPSLPPSKKQSDLMSDPHWLLEHTSASPDFLKGYYGQSRLHVLSSTKEEAKLFVARYYASNPPPMPKKRKLHGTAVDGRTIMHCDLDSFFVSAGLTTRPELVGKAVAVCHAKGDGEGSEGARSTSEIASCSYEARAKGVKNGMSLGRAREMCPEIQTIPFEFELYKSISLTFYTILLKHATFLQAGSMDEAIMSVILPPTITRSTSPALALANAIRAEILTATGCHASIGISHNILLAKLATRHAKPAGSFQLLPEDIEAFLPPLSVNSLPGLGYKLRDKLFDTLGVKTVGDLQKVKLDALKACIGEGNAVKFAGNARGIDPRELEGDKPRMSVSAEVNYGIRFSEGEAGKEQLDRFLRQLSEEVTKRLKVENVQTRQVTLKIMIRHRNAPVETPKFLGHGDCDTENKMSSLASPRGGATDDHLLIAETVVKLYKGINAPPHELRGIGIQLQKLERDGRPVDLVLERGQGTLSFTRAPPKPIQKSTTPVPPASPVDHRPSPPPAAPSKPVMLVDTAQETSEEEDNLSRNLPPPRQTRSHTTSRLPLRSEPSIIVLDSDSDDSTPTPVAGPSRLPPRAAKIAAKNKGKGKEKEKDVYIPSMFRQVTKPSLPPATAGSVSDKELQRLGIDPEVYHALPTGMQREALEQAKRSFKPSKEKVVKVVEQKEKDKKKKGVSFASTTTSVAASSSSALNADGELNLTSSSPLSTAPTSAPNILVHPPSPFDPAPPTETQIVASNFGTSWDALGSRTQKEQVQLYRRQAALTVKGNRSAVASSSSSSGGGGSSSARPSAPIKDVSIRLATRFSRQSGLAEICDKIEQWVGAFKDDGPDSNDVDDFGRFVEKCAKREVGHDLGKAKAVVEWWACVLDGEFDGQEKGGMEEVWREKLKEVKERLEWVVLQESGCRLVW